MASVAVIQGSSRGIGLAFTQHLLRHSSLSVVATTSSQPMSEHVNIIDPDEKYRDRLVSLKVDVRDEDTIKSAAQEVQGRFGQQLRLLINVSGVLNVEKSVTKVNADDVRQTFEINTLGHLLVYKHFINLLPSKSTKWSDQADPANDVLPSNLSILASMSARVGSIGDNAKGGWYSYRSSKAATNQIIKTLQNEINLKTISPTIALALHPGTVAGTSLSGKVVKSEERGKEPGIHGPEDAVQHLFKVMSQLTKNDGGRFIDWAGKDIPW